MRDRATLYVEQLGGKAGGIEAIVEKPERLPLKNLETALQEYLAGSTDDPFDLEAVPADFEEEDTRVKKTPGASQAAGPSAAVDDVESLSESVEQLKSIPEFVSYGPLVKSCESQLLTEEGTEYSVSVVKHIFEAHVVFQFSCMNTVAEQVLEDVRVVLDLTEAVSLTPCVAQE